MVKPDALYWRNTNKSLTVYPACFSLLKALFG
jgi:hypothetical protein